MSQVVKFLRASPARQLVALMVVCILVAGLADTALLVSQSVLGAVTIIHPAPSAILQLPSPTTTHTVPTSCAQAASAANPIAAENTCPGTSAWQVNLPFGNQGAIEAFTVPASVNVGGSIDMYVSTTAPSYSFQLFRMGWYGGLGGRLVYSSPTLTGHAQPAPSFNASTRTVSADTWRNPVQLSIPASYVSGVYLIKLLSSQGFMRYDLFAVRDDASTAPIVFQSSIYTYQAYNPWGGYDLYDDFTTTPASYTQRALAVSMDRPYANGHGLGDFPRWDYPMLCWLERQGYDMSYTTDADLNAGVSLAHHKLIIVDGHGEYWSNAMRAHITAARDQGTSLAFLGANFIFWRVRTADTQFGHDRLIICYKEPGDDPYKGNTDLSTSNWGVDSTPENALLGEEYWARNYDNQDGVLAPSATFLLTGTGLESGNHIPGIIGGELERIQNNGYTPPGTVALLTSPETCTSNACHPLGMTTIDATLYTAASGARVFDAGTFDWSWGLDDGSWPGVTVPPHHFANAAFQKFNANLIAYLLHEPLPGALATPTA